MFHAAAGRRKMISPFLGIHGEPVRPHERRKADFRTCFVVRGEQLPDFLKAEVRTDKPTVHVGRAGIALSDIALHHGVARSGP